MLRSLFAFSFAFVLALAALCAPRAAGAHPLAPSVLSFEQSGDGTVTMRWRAPVKRPTGQSLRPRVPDGCEQTGPSASELNEDETAVTETVELQCEPPDMLGAIIAVDGFEDSTVNVVVRVVRADGHVHHAILDSGTPKVTIVAPTEESSSFFDYLMLGVEHLLTGWDHLTFVIGLLVLFGWHRRLIAAVTAFTIGHSVTLALAVLGLCSACARLRSDRQLRSFERRMSAAVCCVRPARVRVLSGIVHPPPSVKKSSGAAQGLEHFSLVKRPALESRETKIRAGTLGRGLARGPGVSG